MTKHLIGVGLSDAKQVKDLKRGDIIRYNYGARSEVMNVIPHKNSYKITVKQDDKMYTHIKRGNTLMAIV